MPTCLDPDVASPVPPYLRATSKPLSRRKRPSQAAVKIARASKPGKKPLKPITTYVPPVTLTTGRLSPAQAKRFDQTAARAAAKAANDNAKSNKAA